MEPSSLLQDHATHEFARTFCDVLGAGSTRDQRSLVADGCSILSLGPPNFSLPPAFVTDGVGRGTGGLFTGENAIMAGLVLGMALAGVIVVAWVGYASRNMK